MNIVIKKVFSIITILCICIQSSIHTFAAIDTIKKNLDSVETQLQSTIAKADTIMQKVDVYINKTTVEQRRILDKKLGTLRNKIESQTSMTQRETNILLLIDYLQLKIAYKDMLETPQKNNLLQEYNMSLSESETQKFNTTIVQLQKNLLSSSINSLEDILGDFEHLTNIEEAGDFSMKLDVDHEMVGKIKALFELENYTATTSGFDTQLKGNIRALVNNASPQGEESMKFEMKAFIDFISKDQNIYLLMNNFSIISEEGVDNMKAFIEKAKEIAQTNKYIQIPDDQGAQFIALMKGISPQSLSSEGNKIMSAPMFRAYKKEKNKYSIIPTLYACSTMKELVNKFDPFFGKDCTQSQYQDFLGDLAEAGFEMYLETGTNNNTLGFSLGDIDDVDSINGSVSFNDTSLQSLSLVVIPNQQQFPGEGLDIQYEKKSSLSINMTAAGGDTQMVLESLLDGNNLFSSIDMTMKSELMNGSMSLKNNVISGSYNIGPDYQKMVGTISGSTQSDNSLKKLSIKNQLISSGLENITTLDYDMGKILFSNVLNSEYTKGNVNFSGEWDNSQNVFKSIDLSVLYKQKEYSTNGGEADFIDTFNHNFSLNNKRISGKTIINMGTQDFATIDHSGSYQKGMLEFNNTFDTQVMQLLTGSSEELTGNFNIKLDTQGVNNNGTLYLDVVIDSKKALELEITNTGTRVFRKITIDKPIDSQIIPLEEIMENPAY